MSHFPNQRAGQALNRALYCNAVFSTFCGVVLLSAAGPIAQLMGEHHPLVYAVIGFGLLLFAADLIWSARRGVSFWKALYFISGDFAWVIGSMILLTFASGSLSLAGMWVVGVVAAVVFVFGSAQEWFLIQARRAPA